MKRLVTLTAAFAAIALAQPPRGPMGEPKALIEYLGLTSDQVTRLNAANREQMTSMRPTFEQAREKQQALRQLMESANPDPAAVGRAMIEAHQLRQRIGDSNRQAKETALAELEKAQKLQPAIGEAMRFHLLAPAFGPGGEPGFGPGFGGPFAPAGMPRGPRPARVGPPRN
jgi:Spy/CpxP family protein refolding chaperone